MQSYGRRGRNWRTRSAGVSPLVLGAGAIVAVLILILAGIGLASLLSGGDESTPETTISQLTTTTQATTTTTSTTLPAATHVVQSGDSLFSIAEQYGVDLSDLITANPQLADPEDIDIGDVINIPPSGGSSSGPRVTDAAPGDTGSPDDTTTP